jgi:predicted RNA-binding protein with TRAM domain
MRLDKLEITRSFTAQLRRDGEGGQLRVPPALAAELPDAPLKVSVGVPVPVAMPPEPPAEVSPVEVGELRMVTVTDRGRRGDGIARVDQGFVVIIPETAPDDRVLVEIEEVRESYALGMVVETDQPPK